MLFCLPSQQLDARAPPYRAGSGAWFPGLCGAWLVAQPRPTPLGSNGYRIHAAVCKSESAGTPARLRTPFQAVFTVEIGRSEFFGLGNRYGFDESLSFFQACKTAQAKSDKGIGSVRGRRAGSTCCSIRVRKVAESSVLIRNRRMTVVR